MISRQKYRDVAARFVFGEERFVDATLAWVERAQLPEVVDDKLAQCVKLSALLEVAATHPQAFDEERHKELDVEDLRDQAERIEDDKKSPAEHAHRILAAECLWGPDGYSARQNDWIKKGIDVLEGECHAPQMVSEFAPELALAERVALYLLLAESIGFYDRRSYDIIEDGFVLGSARAVHVQEAVEAGLLDVSVAEAVQGLVDDNNRAMRLKNAEIVSLREELEMLKRRYVL